jgi:peptidylprolyl isomerase
MKHVISFLLLLIGGVVLSGCTQQSTTSLTQDTSLTQESKPMATVLPTSALPTPTPTPLPEVKQATPSASVVDLKTSKGVITIKLYPDKAPKTVANFLTKATSKYYDGLIFHRVEDWVIQGGDPDGTGRGGGQMPSEINDVPFTVGSVGIARGMDIAINNDSQFFICVTDCSFLTKNYTNFGEVVTGMDVVKSIAIGDKIESILPKK